MQHQRTTGLTATQFTTLLTALTHHLTWAKPSGRPPALTQTQALKITLLYHRHNLTEELLAELFTVSQPTVSRAINTIERALEKILTPLNRPLGESLKAPGSLVIDGTLIPTWNWRSLGKTNFSGKHKRAGFNHQVICTLGGRLLAITDPLPGARHDAYAFRAHGLDQLLDSSTLADKGYVGLGLATPVKRKPGQRFNAEVKRNNRLLNRLRSVVERVIAHIKTWRVLHMGFRRPLSSYQRVFSVVRGLVFLAAGGTFE
ncbi:transposase family protein [Rothia terrae]|uniref:Transposase n=1 Tax=Rothia terrae TaxID=396015 RepID=A0A7H2BE01_9MICC|nr:transposase family protein [Rothia terrae]QNV37690.1 transposase [Rothia terrae]QNV37897.1 transposase [Rothia terrae]QNV38653.1 transposase [Rothia terrae]